MPERVNNNLIRYGKPTLYDQHPYGTKIVVIPSTLVQKEEWYMQLSKDQDNPRWVKVENTAPQPLGSE